MMTKVGGVHLSQIDEWQEGFKKIINNAFDGTYGGETTACPCTRCHCMTYLTKTKVQTFACKRL
jgi:hypothetical protein